MQLGGTDVDGGVGLLVDKNVWVRNCYEISL